MVGTTQKYFQIIEHAFFVVMCIISVYFVYGVLDKFFAGKTNISQSEEPIKEIPTFVICFLTPNSRMANYEYGSDFSFGYETRVLGKK